ncbi:two component transcriptional regulator, LytTR family [Lachnospiraceae bacterium]|nr:two component transcriptional regulator, LytTR family [Lachnospiraceae bacterium]
MINIAVVDDSAEDRKILTDTLKRFTAEQKISANIVAYQNGEDAINDTAQSFDIFCLDIDMPGFDGIDLAKKIREYDSEVVIVFVTNMAQMAIMGYEVRAMDFILKPIEYYAFSMKMQSIFNIIDKKKSKNLILNLSEGMVRISTDDLYYAEIKGHYLFYHTKSGIYQQRSTISELEEKLTGLSFAKCNQCYLVNLKHVRAVKKDDVDVGGDWLKISRPRKKAFLQSLANYMGGFEA